MYLRYLNAMVLSLHNVLNWCKKRGFWQENICFWKADALKIQPQKAKNTAGKSWAKFMNKQSELQRNRYKFINSYKYLNAFKWQKQKHEAKLLFYLDMYFSLSKNMSAESEWRAFHEASNPVTSMEDECCVWCSLIVTVECIWFKGIK